MAKGPTEVGPYTALRMKILPQKDAGVLKNERFCVVLKQLARFADRSHPAVASHDYLRLEVRKSIS
jgi:hypothetical protein